MYVFQIGFAFAKENQTLTMRTFLALVLWCLLFVICWPIALIMLFLFPFIWLLMLPFRIVGFTIDVIFNLIKGILLFPFRMMKVL
jgi:hypothetical protein